MKLTIKECTTQDIQTLHQISCRTYRDTFEAYNTEANMKAFLEKAYNTEKLHSEILNKDSVFYFVYEDEKLYGYIKLNEAGAQSDINDPDSLEVERLYISKEAHRKGLGSFLMKKAISIAEEKRKSYIWLGVWEHNEKALAFYIRNGFYKIGAHPFIMGDDIQTDLIMRKDLNI